MPDHSYSHLVAHYDRLNSHEKMILQVLSVVYEPTNQVTLKKVLSELARMDERFEGLDLFVDRQFRVKLQGQGLLIINNGKLSCHSNIVEQLTLQTVDKGTFPLILKFAMQFVPLADDFGYRYSYYPTDQTQRKLRYALHCVDDSRVFELLDLEDPWAQPDRDLSRYLVNICANPLHKSWFLTFTPALQYQILRPVFEQGAYDWTDQLVFFEILESLIRDLTVEQNAVASPLLELYAGQKLLRGDWQTLQEDLTRLGTRQADLLLGCLHFMKGETLTSLTFFQSFLGRSRKATRKRRIAVHGFPGVIYLLALLKDQSPANAELARLQLNAVEKGDSYDLQWPAMGMLQVIRDVNDGKTPFERSVFNRHLSQYSPFENLLGGLSLVWNNGSAEAVFLERLEKATTHASRAGYSWFAEQNRQVLAALSNRTLEIDKSLGPPLTDVLPRLERWERSLNALVKVSDAASSSSLKRDQTTSRLAWFLDDRYGALSLKAKEQKLKKNGGWTTGRVVSLKRLAGDSESFAYLTEADHKIIHCIERERSSDYYGYGKISFLLNSTEAMLAAAGHPDLYLSSNPSVQVEIREASPELLVREQGDNLRISLEPYSDGDDCLILEDAPGKYRIYQYSDEHLRIAQILDIEGLEVPLSAKEKVMQSISAIAPLLTVHSDVAGVTETQAQRVTADTRLYIHLQSHRSGLRLSFHVQPLARGPVLQPGRGGASIFAEIEGQRLHTQRDLEAEKESVQNIVETCPGLVELSPGEWQWEEAEEALEGLLTLQSMEDKVVLTWPQGEKIKIGSPVGISQMSISLRQRTDWFEIDGELKADANTVYSMQNLLELISASSGRFIKLADGQFLTLTNELRKRLDELSTYDNNGRVHALNASSLEESIDGMSVSADATWEALKTRLQAARDLNPVLPNTLQADLRDYQLTGFQWLARLAEWGAGACLADDMGLGKTVQSLAVVLSRAERGPTLVLTPTSVCTNWIEETNRFAPTLNPIRFGEGNRQMMLDGLQPYDLLVCSYGLLQVESAALQAVHWNTIIADEAQAFKNPATKRSRAVMGLQGDFKIIATGTPIENHLGELWNLFNFINPGLLGSRAYFNDKFAQAIEGQNDSEARAGLKKLISPFILRRLKRDVLSELPPRTDITLHVDLSDEETALYEALRLEAVNQMKEGDMMPGQQRIRALASITRLRRAVCNPNMVLGGGNMPSAKLEVLGGVLDELLENNHRALVFSQFVDHLSLIRAYLDEQGISYQYLDGATPAKKRTEAVHAFQAGMSELFLISLKAGGIGLNLTAADYVIHMDPWWNPAVEDQASDRAHRIGQQRPVTVYRLVANNTIEEKIVKLHAQKRDLADSLLEGSEISAKMSLDDVLTLLD